MYVYVHVYLHTYITVKWPLKDPRSAHPDNAEGIMNNNLFMHVYRRICMLVHYICICMYMYI
jgi:hypothetical protein